MPEALMETVPAPQVVALPEAAEAVASPVDRYALLASVVAHRSLAVVADTGGVSYTDGATIFVAGVGIEHLEDVVVVQAALIAGGSLEPATVARFIGRRRQRDRYLTLEVARAVHDLGAWIPRSVAGHVAAIVAEPLTASREESVRKAGALREPVPAPPDWFGTIRAAKLWRNADALDGGEATRADVERVGRFEQQPEVDDDDDTERSRLLELLFSGIGGRRNPLSDALQQLLGMSRAPRPGDGGGSPIAGNHRVGRVNGAGARQAQTRHELAFEAAGASVGRAYPEWNWERASYRPDWCAVAEYDPTPRDCAPPQVGADLPLRRELARLGLAPERHRRQPEGDVLDVTSLIDFVVDRRAGAATEERVYETRRRTAHDLGVLVLLDVTGSTSDTEDGRRVFDEQRRVAARLVAGLDELGDRVAAYGFRAWGRGEVQFLRVKGFDDRYDRAAQQRLGDLEPGGFTRLGAAVRHGTHLLTTRAGTANLLLVVVGDGLPFDSGYELRYAQEDSRRALDEAVAAGVGCACLSVRAGTDPAIVDRVWGSVPYRRLADPSELAAQVSALFRQGLKDAAAVRRNAG